MIAHLRSMCIYLQHSIYVKNMYLSVCVNRIFGQLSCSFGIACRSHRTFLIEIFCRVFGRFQTFRCLGRLIIWPVYYVFNQEVNQIGPQRYLWMLLFIFLSGKLAELFLFLSKLSLKTDAVTVHELGIFHSFYQYFRVVHGRPTLIFILSIVLF